MSTEFDIVSYSEYVVNYYENRSITNGTEFYSAFDNIIIVIKSVVDVIKDMSLQWYNGITFNLWYVMIGFLVISILVSMILRMPSGGGVVVNEIENRNKKQENRMRDNLGLPRRKK